MYPILRFKRDGWSDQTAREMADLGRAAAEEMRAADTAGTFPRDVYLEMGRRGWVGPMAPIELGGLGGGVAEYCLIEEEVGRHGLVAPQVSVQGQRWLLDWGTEEQRDRYLPGMVIGTLIFSESISEPGAGSSLKHLQTRAERSGSDWVLTGQKTHVNLGAQCDVTLVYAATDAGMTAFLVDTDLRGVRRRQTDPIGLRTLPTADMWFDEVRLPQEAVLHEVGDGMATFLSTFNVSRLGNASELIGYGRRAMAEGIAYAQQRRVGNSLVADFQAIQWTVAAAYERLHAASLCRDHAANAADGPGDHSLGTSLAKRAAIHAAEYCVNEVYAMIGGHGLYHEQVFGKLLHDTKVLRVAGGSKEVLQNHIARRILKDATYGGVA